MTSLCESVPAIVKRPLIPYRANVVCNLCYQPRGPPNLYTYIFFNPPSSTPIFFVALSPAGRWPNTTIFVALFCEAAKRWEEKWRVRWSIFSLSFLLFLFWLFSPYLCFASDMFRCAVQSSRRQQLGACQQLWMKLFGNWVHYYYNTAAHPLRSQTESSLLQSALLCTSGEMSRHHRRENQLGQTRNSCGWPKRLWDIPWIVLTSGIVFWQKLKNRYLWLRNCGIVRNYKISEVRNYTIKKLLN